MTVKAVAAGVDTWSPSWYVDPGSSMAEELGRICSVKTARGYLLPDPVHGHRVGWIPAVSLLWAEGHPAGDGQLACPDELPRHLRELQEAMWTADLPCPAGRAEVETATAPLVSMVDERRFMNVGRSAGFAGIRRLDSTVDLRFTSGAEGIATLAGIAGLLRGSPRLKLDTIHSVDGKALETVYLRGKQYAARWYDKGVESRTAARGTWIRPEDQRRFIKATRRDVTELHTEYVKTKFKQRFAVLWQASKGVTVGGVEVLATKLSDAVVAGKISPLEAERLAGHLLLQRVDVGRSRATDYRRRARCQELGLVLADGVLQEVEINLQDVMEEVLDTPAWGNRG